MPDTVRRLLQMHDFLHRSLQEHGAELATNVRESMLKERDELLLRLLKHRSSEPQITLAQFKMLIASLAEQSDTPESAALLTQYCLEAAERLVRQSTRSRVMGEHGNDRASGTRRPAGIDQRLWDTLPDRVGVIDRNYRYVWTNKANAAFYDTATSDFVSRPLLEQVGKKCFTELSKPNIDSCLGGAALRHVTGHYARGKLLKYLISYDPVLDEDGDIEAVMIVARDVSDLPVEPKFIWPARDA